jgi:iron complex transport system permease protein
MPGIKMELEEHYALLSKRKMLLVTGSLMLLIVLIPVATSVGAASLSIIDVLHAIGVRLFPFWIAESGGSAETIVWDLRLPRVAMAVIAGSGFALSGSVMQGVMRNPLVSPYTLGISAAAGFGAALAIVLGVGITGGGASLLVSNAFLFALIAAFIVFFLAKLRRMTPESLILAGIATMYFFSALTSSLQYIGTTEQVNTVVFWLLGSLAASSWQNVLFVTVILVVSLPVMIKYSWDLNAMAAGDETAVALGTNIKSARLVCLITATLITAAIVCFNGVIGFICLVAPHIARLIVGNDYRYLLPYSCICGAVLLLLSDTLARLLFQPLEIPIGIMTAVIGVPFFVYLILTRKREYFS